MDLDSESSEDNHPFDYNVNSKRNILQTDEFQASKLEMRYSSKCGSARQSRTQS